MWGTAGLGTALAHRAQHKGTACPQGCGERACPLKHSTVQGWDARHGDNPLILLPVTPCSSRVEPCAGCRAASAIAEEEVVT